MKKTKQRKTYEPLHGRVNSIKTIKRKTAHREKKGDDMAQLNKRKKQRMEQNKKTRRKPIWRPTQPPTKTQVKQRKKIPKAVSGIHDRANMTINIHREQLSATPRKEETRTEIHQEQQYQRSKRDRRLALAIPRSSASAESIHDRWQEERVF